MVRSIIPGRLKSSSSIHSSRTSSPMRSNSYNGAAPTSNPKMPFELSPPKDNGLALKVVILRVRFPRTRRFPEGLQRHWIPRE